jgi:hypothetical protein
MLGTGERQMANMKKVKAWFRGARKFCLAGAIIAMAILWSIEHPFFMCHPN